MLKKILLLLLLFLVVVSCSPDKEENYQPEDTQIPLLEEIPYNEEGDTVLIDWANTDSIPDILEKREDYYFECSGDIYSGTYYAYGTVDLVILLNDKKHAIIFQDIYTSTALNLSDHCEHIETGQ